MPLPVRKTHTDALVSFFMLIAGLLLYYFNTSGVPGVTNDSAFYFQSAEYIMNSKAYLMKVYGVVKPAVQFPPLYSFLLAAVSFLIGCPFTTAAIVINAIAWSVSILGVYALLRLNKRPVYLSVLFAFLALVQHDVVHVFYMAWSEGIFIALSLWGFYFLNRGFLEHRYHSFIFAGLAFGLATMARYTGYIFLPVMVLSILFVHDKIRNRIKAMLIASAAYLLFVVAWWIRNKVLTGQWMGRENKITNTAIPDNFFQTGVQTISGWIYPGWLGLEPLVAGAIICFFLSFGTYYLWLRLKQKSLHFHPEIPLIIYCIGYLLLNILTVKFVDKTTFPDNRILSPLNLTFILFCFFVLSNKENLKPIQAKIRNIAWVGFLILLLLEMQQVTAMLQFHSHNGSDLTANNIKQEKPVIQKLIDIQDTLPILSDGNEDIYLHFLTGKKIGYTNDLYQMPVGQELYFAYYTEREKLPETGYTYLHTDTILKGYLYKVEIK